MNKVVNPIFDSLTLTGALNAPAITSTATGAISSRTLAEHFANVIYAKDFGAVFDGASHPLSNYFTTLADAQAVYPHAVALTDEIDGVAIQAALNLCIARSGAANSWGHGGTVIVPTGKGLVNQPLWITAQNVSLQSQGRGFMVDSNVQRAIVSAPTRLTWTGAAVSSGAFQNNMLTVAPRLVDGRTLTGCNITGILFDCAGVVGTAGPLFASVRHSVIDVATNEPRGVAYPSAVLTVGSQTITVSSTAGLRIGESVVSASLPDGAYVAAIIDGTTFNASVQAAATSTETITVGGEGIRFDVVDQLRDSNDTQNCQVRFAGTALQGAANATAPLVFIGGSGVVGSSSGTHWGNTSLMWFDTLHGVINNGHGIVCNNSDHNFHENINFQKVGVGSGKSLICNGSLDTHNGTARFHQFRHIAGDTHFTGTDTGGFTSGSGGNTIWVLDMQNGAPAPTVGTGASVRVSADNLPSLVSLGGTQAVQAHVTTSSILGGNGRGQYAVDLQTDRTTPASVASGNHSAVLGGSDNSAARQFSTVIGGLSNHTGFDYAVASGQGALADGYASWAHSSGTIASGRRAQKMTQILRAKTATNGTAVRLVADGTQVANGVNCVNIPLGASAIVLRVQLVAINTTTPTQSFAWSQSGGLLAKSVDNASTTYAGNAPTTQSNGTLTGIGVSEAADTANGGYALTFTPPTANTEVWHICATVEYTRIE